VVRHHIGAVAVGRAGIEKRSPVVFTEQVNRHELQAHDDRSGFISL
jgi:hypothetical protein